MSPTMTTLDTLSAIEQRRSIKHYDPTHEMSGDEIKKLLELTLLSPTSFNMQNWRFVTVDRSDASLREQLCAASYNQAQVKDASLVVAICANLKSWAQEPQRYWRNAPEAVQQMMAGMIPQFYNNNLQLERDEAMRSGGIASQTLMLAAKAMGYDSCPMVGFNPQQVAELIQLPADHMMVMLVVVGKATQPAGPRSGPLAYDEVVFANRFPR